MATCLASPAILSGRDSTPHGNHRDCGGGKLTPELAVSATQTALVLMGNAYQHMAQGRRKHLLMNLDPALKGMANDKRSFRNVAPMLFGERIRQIGNREGGPIKTISKFSTKLEP